MSLPKRTPTHTAHEYELARAGVAARTPRAVPVHISKPELPPPRGRGGELWTKFYANAVKNGHPQPEKLADALLRSRERAEQIEAKRHKLIHVPDHKPKPQEVAAPVAKAGKKPVVCDALRCKALTLEGRRCGFKATCGDFCKKHSTTEKM